MAWSFLLGKWNYWFLILVSQCVKTISINMLKQKSLKYSNFILPLRIPWSIYKEPHLVINIIIRDSLINAYSWNGLTLLSNSSWAVEELNFCHTRQLWTETHHLHFVIQSTSPWIHDRRVCSVCGFFFLSSEILKISVMLLHSKRVTGTF